MMKLKDCKSCQENVSLYLTKKKLAEKMPLDIVNFLWLLPYLEAVVQRCSVKKVFLEISQNSQENTCARVSFLIKL